MPKADLERIPAAAGSSGVERRKSPRADLVVRVDYRTVDQLFSEFTTNINEGGIFIETDLPASLGSQVSLQFALPASDEPIQVRGRVVHVSDGRGSDPPGMGIEFDDLGSGERDRIDDLVRRLRPVR